MAQAILERVSRTRDLEIEVTSAGVRDFTGTPPADNAWLTCLQKNTSISKMESLFVGKLDLDSIDRFLAMEQVHKDVLMASYGVDESRIQLLGVFDGMCDEPEIEDPINKPKVAFQDCFNRIERCIEGFLARIETSEPGRGGGDGI